MNKLLLCKKCESRNFLSPIYYFICIGCKVSCCTHRSSRVNQEIRACNNCQPTGFKLWFQKYKFGPKNELSININNNKDKICL